MRSPMRDSDLHAADPPRPTQPPITACQVVTLTFQRMKYPAKNNRGPCVRNDGRRIKASVLDFRAAGRLEKENHRVPSQDHGMVSTARVQSNASYGDCRVLSL